MVAEFGQRSGDDPGCACGNLGCAGAGSIGLGDSIVGGALDWDDGGNGLNPVLDRAWHNLADCAGCCRGVICWRDRARPAPWRSASRLVRPLTASLRQLTPDCLRCREVAAPAGVVLRPDRVHRLKCIWSRSITWQTKWNTPRNNASRKNPMPTN